MGGPDLPQIPGICRHFATGTRLAYVSETDLTPNVFAALTTAAVAIP